MSEFRRKLSVRQQQARCTMFQMSIQDLRVLRATRLKNNGLEVLRSWSVGFSVYSLGFNQGLGGIFLLWRGACLPRSEPKQSD